MKKTIIAPNLGQRMTFAPEDHDTLRASCVLEPGASVPMHVHLRQHERFEVRAGALEVWIDGERQRCGPGSDATIAPGVAHRFRNLSGAPVEVDISIWPALRSRLLFSRLFALDAEGKLNRAGAPGPLRLGLLTREFGDELFLLARIPASVQLAAGRLLGRARSPDGEFGVRLFVCWGLFKTPGAGHPCRNAWEALKAACDEPEVVRARGWGLLPASLNRTRGRREVRRLTGQDWVPVLACEDGEVVAGTEAIVAWAAAHPR